MPRSRCPPPCRHRVLVGLALTLSLATAAAMVVVSTCVTSMDGATVLVNGIHTAVQTGASSAHRAQHHDEPAAISISVQGTHKQHEDSETAAVPDTTEEPPEFPNIIFMLADDMGYGDVGYNGGGAETPNLDAMAGGRHSVRMTRFYSGAPVCSPTRGTVLTGRNHNRYCVWSVNRGTCGDGACPQGMPLPTSEVTVARILREHDYRTAAFGKWHLGDLDPCPIEGAHPLWPTSHPGMHGFDTWWMTDRILPTVDPNCACFEGESCESGHFGDKRPTYCRNYHTVDSNNSSRLRSWPDIIRGDDSLFLFDQVKEFVEDAVSKRERFFVYLAFHTPHTPVIATESHRRRYIDRGIDAVGADYFGAVTAMDEAVGKIRELLKSANVSRNTLLWFASDNGPRINGPGSAAGLRGYKGSLYEGGIRVPAIIEWPAVIHRHFDTQFHAVTSDLLPTVCDILGTSPPRDRDIDGVSILPMLRRERETRDNTIMFMYNKYDPRPGSKFGRRYRVAGVAERYKVIAVYREDKVDSVELYDLVSDETESTDVSGSRPEVVEEMMEELEKWRLSVERSAEEEVGCLEYSRPADCRYCNATRLACDLKL